jgi:hypothetical protein
MFLCADKSMDSKGAQTSVILLPAILIPNSNIFQVKRLWMPHCGSDRTPLRIRIASGKLKTIKGFLELRKTLL